MLTKSLVQTVVARRFGETKRFSVKYTNVTFFPTVIFYINALSDVPEKIAHISRGHYWFPRVVTSAPEK